MAEAMIPAAIGAGGSLISGLIGANAAGEASQAQQAGIRRGQDIQAQLALLARGDLAPQRDFNTSSLNYLADIMGLQTGDALGNKTGGPGRDPYNVRDPDAYSKLTQPYITGLQPISNNVAGIANMFGGPMDEGGQPAWYRNALAGFKQSPGYAFTRDEAMRSGLQAAGTGGNISGGGRIQRMQQIAAGLANQDFDKYRENVINSILGGGKMALGANAELSNLLGLGLSWGTAGMRNDDTRYTDYFNRLSTAAGLGSAGVGKSADIAASTGTNLAQLMQNEGTAAARGITGSANALGTGITGAVAPFASPYGPIWNSSSGNALVPGTTISNSTWDNAFGNETQMMAG